MATTHYGYDLKNQGDRIEFDAITYYANYFDLTDINSTSPRTFCAFAPFASNDSSPSVDPNKPLPEVSPLSYLEKDGGIEDQSHAVWL